MDSFIRYTLRILMPANIVLLIAISAVDTGIGQEPQSTTGISGTAVESPTPAETPRPVPTPIPVSDINPKAEETRLKIDTIKNSLVLGPEIINIRTSLSQLTKDFDVKAAETKNLLNARPSLETLKTIEQDWQAASSAIPAWKNVVTTAIEGFDKSISELEELKSTWKLTLGSFEQGSQDKETGTGGEGDSITGNNDVPEALVTTVRSMVALIESTEKSVRASKSDVLSLQTSISKQDNRRNEMLKSISDLRAEALTHLLVRDSPPIWSASKSTSSFGELFSEAGQSYRKQFESIREYVSGKFEAIILHVLIFLVFAGVLLWARKRARPLVEKEPEIGPAYSVFELPVAGALVLAVLLSGRLYPQAPRMMMAILGAAALVPGVLYLRKILEKPLYPIFNALLALYLVDLLRQITATLPLLTRIIFSFEMLGAITFLLWFLWSRRVEKDTEDEYQDIFLVIRKAVPVIIVLFAVSLIASIFGYVSLSHTVGNSVLASSYTALILYATVQIIKSLVVFALRIRPLSELGMVQNHRSLIKNKCFRLLKWAGIISWVLLTLNLFSIRQSVLGYIGDWLSHEISVGSLSFTAGDLLVFGFTVWLAFAISRLVRFVLEEDIYTRVELGGGVAYAISTILHYVLLLVGVLLAIAAIGVDLTNFTILAGAFGVGLGFGMQAIVNNFVSGLILLFERPVKVEDFVQVGTHQGELKRIGLRASVLRTLDGSEVILPNGQLISEEVTNWTFSDQERRLEISVGVAYGTDPRQVLEMFDRLAAENKDILSEPGPRSIFVGFGESSLDFQLRAWTDKADQWVIVQSDLTLAIHDALLAAGIEIPFPQRDIHIRGDSTEEKKTEK